MTKLACIGCGAVIRRSRSTWGGCPACVRTVEAHLKATVGTRDPSAWQRACNRTFGSREAFVRVAAAERAA
jgi:hypothetical protein